MTLNAPSPADVRNMCSCIPTRPGMAVLPVPSIREAPAGRAREPSGPIAAIRPWSMRIVWPARGAAPVPSMTRTCSMATSGERSRIRDGAAGAACGRALPGSKAARAARTKRNGRMGRAIGSLPLFLSLHEKRSERQRQGSGEPKTPRQAPERQPVLPGEAVAQRQPGGGGPQDRAGGEAGGAVQRLLRAPHQGAAGEREAEARDQLVGERIEAVAQLELDGRRVGRDDRRGADGHRHAERPRRRHQPEGDSREERHGDEGVERRQNAVADHLDDRRGRADDRFHRARADEDEEQRQRALRLGAVEAENVDSGEDQQAGERDDERGRDPAGEMVERPDLAAVDMGLGRGERAEHILEGLADDQGHGRDLARDLEQGRGRGAASAGKHQVENHRRRVAEGAPREVRGEQAEAGRDQLAGLAARQWRAQDQAQIVIAAEQADAEQRGHPQRAEMGGDQAERAGAGGEEAEREQDARDLLPEDAQANLGPEGAPRPGGGGGDLDEGPQRQRPGEQGDGQRQAGGILGRGGEDRRDGVGVQSDGERDQAGGDEGDQQRQPHRAVRSFLVLGRNHPLKGERHRQVNDVGGEVHRAPQDDVDAVGGEAEQPGVERLRQRLDQRPKPREAREAGAARDVAPGDGGGRRGGRIVLHRPAYAGLAPATNQYPAPSAAHRASTGNAPILSRKMAIMATAARTRAGRLALASTGRSKSSGPAANWRCWRNRVWKANQKARFRITPTIAAVIAASAADSALLPRSRSTKGAPRKIHRKQGTKVTQVVRMPPSVPASNGLSPVAWRNAPMKPTNWVTMIRGPGVVSAMPRPSSISPGRSQPNLSTASCAT